jgi:hypothetical protein
LEIHGTTTTTAASSSTLNDAVPSAKVTCAMANSKEGNKKEKDKETEEENP